MPKFNPLDNLIKDGGNTAILRTLGIIGDSLSSGEFESLDENDVVGYHDYLDFSWGQFLARSSGIKVLNISHGGTTAMDYLNEYKDHPGWLVKCNAYLIFLGENELYQNLKLGSVDNLEEDSYIANLSKIIKIYREIEPKSRFFIVVIPHDDLGPERNQAIDYMKDEIYKLVKLYEFCYVIDLASTTFVYDQKFRDKYAMGFHPTPQGYLYLSWVMGTYIDHIIDENYEDFKQIGFIGTEFFNKNCK